MIKIDPDPKLGLSDGASHCKHTNIRSSVISHEIMAVRFFFVHLLNNWQTIMELSASPALPGARIFEVIRGRKRKQFGVFSVPVTKLDTLAPGYTPTRIIFWHSAWKTDLFIIIPRLAHCYIVWKAEWHTKGLPSLNFLHSLPIFCCFSGMNTSAPFPIEEIEMIIADWGPRARISNIPGIAANIRLLHTLDWHRVLISYPPVLPGLTVSGILRTDTPSQLLWKFIFMSNLRRG